MKISTIIFATGLTLSTLHGADSAFELRLVVDRATNGAVEMNHKDMKLWVEGAAAFTCNDIKQAGALYTPEWEVTIKFTDEAAKRFGDYSKTHVGSQLAILSRGKIVSAPVLRQAITGGAVNITGLTQAAARDMAAAIKAELKKTSAK